jgi:hypothetical protein
MAVRDATLSGESAKRLRLILIYIYLSAVPR